MSDYQPLEVERYARAGFRRAGDVRHARSDRFAPVVLDELSQVLTRMPLCFVEAGSQAESGRFRLVAMQALDGDHNLYLHPRTGKYLGGYIPACYRGYPFALVADRNGEPVLGFDRDSGLLVDQPYGDATPFFDAEGNPSEDLARTRHFLDALAASRRQTQAAVDALDRAGVIAEWPLRVRGDDGGRTLEGLYRIDEAALERLDGDTAGSLHDVHALRVAYAQVFSRAQVKRLGQLRQVHARAEQGKKASRQDLDARSLFGLGDDVMFDFDG